MSEDRVLFEGVDSTTPDGCTIKACIVLGVETTYLLRDGLVLGRVESNAMRSHSGLSAYVGDRMKGGKFIGTSQTYEAAFAKILDQHKEDQ